MESTLNMLAEQNMEIEDASLGDIPTRRPRNGWHIVENRLRQTRIHSLSL